MLILRLIQRHARAIGLTIAFLLFVDLFFHWRQAPVHTRWIDESGAATALLGFGSAVVAFLFAYLLVELLLGRRGRKIAAFLAVGAATLTFAEFFLSSPIVSSVEGAVVSDAEQTLWPAYAGLALAVLLVLAAVNRMLAPPPEALPLPPMNARVERTPVAGSAA